MIETVLIIERETSSLAELRREFDQTSLTIEIESDQNRALETIKERPSLSIVIINVSSEEVKLGLDIIHGCKDENIPFIIMISNDDPALYQQMISQGPEALYTQPIDYDSLKYFVQKHFRNKKVEKAPPSSEEILVKKKSAIVKIDPSDILLVHGEGNYATIFTANEKFVLRKSLKQLSNKLPESDFLRIHRNYLARIQSINKFDIHNSTVLINKDTIPVGRSYKKELKDRLFIK